MSLADQISNDMKEAMKAKNDATLSTLRLLRSALKNKQIDLLHELSESEIQEVIKTQVKQLKDALDQFISGGRQDLAEANQKEMHLLKKYLPAELSDAELEGIVKEAVIASGATSKSEMGKAMGLVMKAVAGRADGNRVKSLVESMLAVMTLVVVGSMMGGADVFAAIDYINVPAFGSVSVSSSLDMSLRLIRVLFLWAGLFCLNAILHGCIKMCTCGGRDQDLHSAEHTVLHGFIGITVSIGLFFVTSMMIGKIV